MGMSMIIYRARNCAAARPSFRRRYFILREINADPLWNTHDYLSDLHHL